MKKYLPFLFILVLTSCYTVYNFEPYNPQNMMYGGDRKIAYQENDSVIVSVAFVSYIEGIYTLETTIDNQTSHPVSFDPANVYLFRYNTDSSLADKSIFYASTPQKDIDSIDKKVNKLEEKVTGSTFLSIFLGMAYIGASVASIGNEDIAASMDAISAVHEAAQISLDMGRQANFEKMANLSCEKQNIANTIEATTIEPGGFTGGNVRFYVPYADFYKVYVNVNNRIYRYTFHGEKMVY